MRIKGLTISQLEQCATNVGVQLDNVRIIGNYVHFKVNLIGEKYRKYKGTRKVWAVCWHGFRDFFRQVYGLNEDAIVQTAFAKYNSLEHFYSTYPATGKINIGSQVDPIPFNKACQCYPQTADILKASGIKI